MKLSFYCERIGLTKISAILIIYPSTFSQSRLSFCINSFLTFYRERRGMTKISAIPFLIVRYTAVNVHEWHPVVFAVCWCPASISIDQLSQLTDRNRCVISIDLLIQLTDRIFIDQLSQPFLYIEYTGNVHVFLPRT